MKSLQTASLTILSFVIYVRDYSQITCSINAFGIILDLNLHDAVLHHVLLLQSQESPYTQTHTHITEPILVDFGYVNTE